MTTDQCIEMLRGIAPELKQRFGILGMTLFGSFARGLQTSASDIDLYVETETPNPFNLLAMREYIKGVTGTDVDVVRRHKGINIYLLSEINRYGINIF